MKVLALSAAFAVCSLASGQQQPQSQASGRQQPNPCDTKHGVIGDVNYCDRYWQCHQGNAELYDCPNGLVFLGHHRGIADGCDYPWRTNTCEGKTLANGPITTDNCEWLYGTFGHSTSCTRYWTCWNGTATEKTCNTGLLYNEETHDCTWPDQVKGCQKHPICGNDPSARVSLGQSCERYWECQGGYPRIQRCPASLVFSPELTRCVERPITNCPVLEVVPQKPRQQQEIRINPKNRRRQNVPARNSQAARPQPDRRQQSSRQQQQAQEQPRQTFEHAQQFQEEPQQFQEEQPQQFQDQQQFEEEVAPQQQFIENSQFEEPAQPEEPAPVREVQRPRISLPPRPVRPQRPSSSSNAREFPLPEGARPLPQNNRSSGRRPPIPGATPVRS